MGKEQKPKILIVDDSELNRAILADMLDDEYEIIEAENGLQGVGLLQQQGTEISLVLLDIVMPEMDGFGVLEVMAQNHWTEDIPVIMISAETAQVRDHAGDKGTLHMLFHQLDALVSRLDVYPGGGVGLGVGVVHCSAPFHSLHCSMRLPPSPCVSS